MTHTNMHPEAGGDFIGARETAAILKVDRATVTRMVQRGLLAPDHRLGAVLAFDRRDVEEMAAKRAAA